ncbi:MAG: response regulator transcription factor [Cyclobacteriaceae bacterium]|jgi:two-component system LytT family response regulator|nr:response regulator transcription factor [Cyclobacteriaceae bacterium]
MIRTLLIDDEKPFITSVRTLLSSVADVVVVGEARSVASGLVQIDELEPDLIFLDIEMEDGTGFDLLKQIDRRDFKVIFITAYDHYAVEAFRFSAIDYLLKPITSVDLYAALDKVREATGKEKINYQLSVLMENIHQLSKEKKKIVLRELDTLHVIQLDEILWCNADGSYSIFYLTGGRKIMVSQHLKEFEDLLSPNGFFRVHRAHLVNLNKVRKFTKSEGGTILLEENISLPVSVRKRERLAEMLAHF